MLEMGPQSVECRSVFEGSRVHFLVLSRRLAARRVMAVPYLVISIADAHESYADAILAECPLRRAVLRLRFDDYDADDPPADARLFNETDAKMIVRFVDSHLYAIGGILVQCAMGISRSSAVAAALSLALNGEDDFFDRHFRPNPRVRSILTRQIAIMEPEGWSTPTRVSDSPTADTDLRGITAVRL